MTDKAKLYVVRNDDGEYLMDPGFVAWFPDWIDDVTSADLYERKEQAEEVATKCDGHVVELVEAPAKVVVSEEEDKVLKKAKDTTTWRPAAVIEKYAYEHERMADDEVLLEGHLMRAYVIGWAVEKPKRWNVKVPLVQSQGGMWFYINSDDKLDAIYIQELAKKFTMDEIEENGLQDCEKEEVTDDEQ